MLSTPSCVSLSSSRRDSSSGPISCTVARIGMALLAEQVPEHGRVGGVGPVVEADLLGALGEPVLLLALGSEMPDRSPLMSAANTGTPASEKPSASTCSVTVLPVPVAPVTRPWRLASLSSRYSGSTLRPRKILPSCISASLFAMACSSGQRRLENAPFRPDYTPPALAMHGCMSTVGITDGPYCRKNGHWPKAPEWVYE